MTKVLLYTSQLELLSLPEKLLWSLAIVATLLVVILLLLNVFGIELDAEKRSERFSWLDAKTVLLFFAFLGWFSILVHLWVSDLSQSLLLSFLPALLIAGLPHLMGYLQRRQRIVLSEAFDLNQALTSTGEALTYIPSGERGRGKVHLNLRNAPAQVEAISRGGDLAAGMPIRVVEITDDNVLIVEPLDGRPPHAPQD